MSSNRRRELRYRERHELRQKQKRERKYAQRAKEAKGYYGVPSAKHAVLGALVEWRKGEKCKPHDRENYWNLREAYNLYDAVDGAWHAGGARRGKDVTVTVTGRLISYGNHWR